MGNNKIRIIALVATLVILALAVLPGAVEAKGNTNCVFYGDVVMSDDSPVPPGITVNARLPGVDAGPWAATMTFSGKQHYYVLVPHDNAATPAVDGGVNGDDVVLNVYINGNKALIRKTAEKFQQQGFENCTLIIEAPMTLVGDANGDGLVNIGDVLYVELYMRGDPITLGPGADANQDGLINIADIITIELIMSGRDP